MTHHAGSLLAECKDEDLVERLKAGDRGAVTDPAEVAMLDYVEVLTKTPWSLAEADVQALRDAGWDDRAVLDIAQVTAYFNFVNRLADGLGVELES